METTKPGDLAEQDFAQLQEWAARGYVVRLGVTNDGKWVVAIEAWGGFAMDPGRIGPHPSLSFTSPAGDTPQAAIHNAQQVLR